MNDRADTSFARQRQATVMLGLDDLHREWQSEAGTIRFARREQRSAVCESLVAHSAPAIGDGNRSPVAGARCGNENGLTVHHVDACFDGVYEEVRQRLDDATPAELGSNSVVDACLDLRSRMNVAGEGDGIVDHLADRLGLEAKLRLGRVRTHPFNDRAQMCGPALDALGL